MNPPPRHLAAVRSVLDNAIEPPLDVFDPPGGRAGDDDSPPPREMPAGCPVKPLGTQGGVYWFLSALGELRDLRARDLGNKDIVGLFAPFVSYLYEQWPAKKLVAVRDDSGELIKDADGEKVMEWVVNGWKTAEVTELLMDAAGARGVWNPRDKVRGRGAHRDDLGRLVLHCGDWILIGGNWMKPADHGGFVYPTAPPLPRPAPREQLFTIEEEGGKREVPVGIALKHWLSCWNWQRPTIDTMLALGFIAIAPHGGAIDWRPLAWLTGGAGEGKSSLMEFIGDLFASGMLKLEQASEAAVRQLLGQDTLPVVLDETESEDDDRQMQAIIKLARIAASGGNVGKGGADHQGVQFTARSCFLFSSILIPPLQPQDKSRMAVLALKRLPAGAREPEIIKPAKRAERLAMSAALRRRMVSQWGRWEQTFEAFSDALIDYGGHKGRGAKVFATLLAAAHLALDDDPPEEHELAHWGRELAASRLAETADAEGDDKRAIRHLATCQVQLAGSGAQKIVAEWIEQAVRKPPPGCSVELSGEIEAQRKVARDALARIGLGIFLGKARKRGAEDEGADRPVPVEGREYLAVANSHQGLSRLFQESGWKGRAGTDGGWAQSLKRLEGAVPNENQRIAGIQMKCTLVPLSAVWGDVAEPEAQRVDQAEAADA